MTDAVRRALEFAAEHMHSDWPERCQEIVRRARAALAEQPVESEPAQSLSTQMQQQCSDWGVYWRAPDAHGVNLSHEQALELLRFALGVEVEIAATPPPAEARAVPEGMVLAPHFRGYAHLGTGQYLLNHSAADEPAELVVSIATDEQKAGREVGDDRGNPADAPIQPEVMAVRLRFENVAGLDALEKQLRYLRAEHFAATPSPAEQPKPAVSFQRRPIRRTPS